MLAIVVNSPAYLIETVDQTLADRIHPTLGPINRWAKKLSARKWKHNSNGNSEQTSAVEILEIHNQDPASNMYCHRISSTVLADPEGVAAGPR